MLCLLTTGCTGCYTLGGGGGTLPPTLPVGGGGFIIVDDSIFDLLFTVSCSSS